MTRVCQHCGGTGFEPNEAEGSLADFHAWCRAEGITLVRGSLIREADAARYLGRSEKTLRNWRSLDMPLRPIKIRGRIYYEGEHVVGLISSHI